MGAARVEVTCINEREEDGRGGGGDDGGDAQMGVGVMNVPDMLQSTLWWKGLVMVPVCASFCHGVRGRVRCVRGPVLPLK
jgi:hypothetical protein